MSPRAARPDKALTRAAKFLDDRSFVDVNGDEYLYGDDKRARRAQVYWRDDRRCQMCGKMAGWNEGEMHHKQGGLVKRTDNLSNLSWVCGDCHRKEHVQVQNA